ncbi:RICIN domain-containing protein [Streptomyces xanthophaeus]|uniref:RICIN domain-containing protein n=1 Tax=Streptomyces xanthophaeus TaxID=67385 RepID=UPI00398FED9F
MSASHEGNAMAFFRGVLAAAAAMLSSGLLLTPTANPANAPTAGLRTPAAFGEAGSNGAQIMNGPFRIRAVHSNKCLDVAGGTDADADGVNVHQWTCLGYEQSNQKWFTNAIDNSRVFIVAGHSANCLDVAGGTGAVGDGVNVHQWTCLGIAQTNQQWTLDHLGNGRFHIRAVHSGKCLDVAGGTGAVGDGVNVHQWTCLGDAQTNQQWTFELVPGG